jgi:hypothetical protein
MIDYCEDIRAKEVMIFLGVLSLIEVELGDLKKRGQEISRLLEEKLGTDVPIKGSKLIISEANNHPQCGVKDVKMEVKRILHHLGFSNYRALEEHHRILVVRVKQKRKLHTEKKGLPPPPSQSLPYLFP